MKQQLSLRKWREEDIDRVVGLANNPRIAQFLDDGFPHPYSEADGRAFLQKIREADEYHLFRAICLDGLFIGSIGLHPKSGIQRHVLEIGYWLGEPFWGRGIMSWAIQEMCAALMGSVHPLRRIVSVPIHAVQDRSAALMGHAQTLDTIVRVTTTVCKAKSAVLIT